MTSLNFIELSSYVEPPAGYPSGPDFDTQLWPLIVSKTNEIEQVLLFAHASSKLDEQSVQRYQRLGNLFASVGPMRGLPGHVLESLKHWSFSGGHLSVPFKIKRDSSILTGFLRLYQSPGEIGNTSSDTLGLEPSERAELAKLVDEVGDQYVFVSFAHDGDPLYIFGSHSSLEWLLAKA